MGKSRLVPLKAVTIPHLELTAAVLAVRIGAMLYRELDVRIDDSTYWTDSTTVLKYLNNAQNRYKIFIANRVKTILATSTVEQWRYVEGSSNLADDTSRGLEPTDLDKRWITGPEFLWKAESMWPRNPVDVKVCKEYLDAQEIVCLNSRVNGTIDVNRDFLQRFSYFSNWYRLKRAIALVLKLQSKYLKNSNDQNKDNGQCKITEEDLTLKSRESHH
ncbi:uncharacterized protein LOC110239149 [Exaiptasia diaphana]|uniref:Uncharacterized protein n=1 Tax=Exaiptasia diaphana TaxID=2652724 RepID=A0A913X8G0_EXADI|nr:uncharacterized protein LOC110239149 [Exaiptasia diaphana]